MVRKTPDAKRPSKNGKVEVRWDETVETTKRMDDNRLDIIAIDKVNKKLTVLDFSV